MKYVHAGILASLLVVAGGCDLEEVDRPEQAEIEKPQETTAPDLEHFQEVEVANVLMQPRTQTFAALLKTVNEDQPKKIIPIFIGQREAEVLRLGLTGEMTTRPLTHNLTVGLIQKLGAGIEYAAVEDIQENVFLARVFLKDAQGQLVSIDSRASDAIILAVQAGRKIYIHNDIVAESGISADEDEPETEAIPI